MKKTLSLILCALLLMAGAGYAQTPVVRVASLKGPTSMGLVGMIDEDKDAHAYTFTVAGTADEIVPLLVKGDLDIALVPCNLASVLYQKTKGGVQLAAINTLGVLYVVEKGDTVHSVQDLQGRTMLSTGKGTTPEYALNAVLGKTGVTADIQFKSESTEVAAALAAGQADLAMLPQPYVTAVQAQNPDLRVALSLTDEWARVMPDSALVTGVVLVRAAFAKENPEALASFMDSYRASTAFVNDQPEQASVMIEQLGVAKAAVAQKAIPFCNIVCIEGAQMKDYVSGYLTALFEQDPASVGGALPDDAFYLQ